MPRKFKTGDRVQWSAFGVVGDKGVVQSVIPKRHHAIGGARAAVTVKWDNGHVGTVEDRVLVHIVLMTKEG